MTVPDDHVEERLLGLHYLGELDAAQSDVIHRHLTGCAACRALAEALVETLAALALLGDGADVAQPRRRPKRRASDRRASGGRASGHPGQADRPRASRRARLIREGGLLVFALILASLGLVAVVRDPPPPDGPDVVSVAATATDATSGASASVFVTGGDSGVAIRATVNGLRSGTAYVLYAVTIDGQSRPVHRWTSGPAVGELTAELDGVHLDELSFFTVSPEAGGVVVSVYLPGATGAPTPVQTG
ncbi:zf-HC2 domain-containing protein [Verrucosispora sp. WMMA2044]|uniref:anti-sigma factor n=1 Tax=Verrucosispora sp. WMMA2044 TaxID=3016419 RepID=UPI00248B5C5B|nr:zf-HC2 domain-containing protein [Verrucosispora sp. WMMA2044]WBB49685.1 zf-HC2 domain-containing protein [Verrucosispora sp. WMMA2044]